MDPSKEVWTTEKKIALLNAEIERMQLELQNEPSAHLGAVWPFGEWVDSADEVDRFFNDMFFPVIQWLWQKKELEVSDIKMGQADDPIFGDHVDKHIHYTSKSYPPNKIFRFKVDQVMIYIFVYINRQKHPLTILCRELRDKETFSLRLLYKAAFINNSGVLNYDARPGDAFRTKLFDELPSLYTYIENKTHEEQINQNRRSDSSSDRQMDQGDDEYSKNLDIVDTMLRPDLVSIQRPRTQQAMPRITVLPKTFPVPTGTEHEKRDTSEPAMLGASFFKNIHSISAREDLFFNNVFFPFVEICQTRFISDIKIGSYSNPNFSKFIYANRYSHSYPPNRVITFCYNDTENRKDHSVLFLVYININKTVDLAIRCHDAPQRYKISLESEYDAILQDPYAHEIKLNYHTRPSFQLYYMFSQQILGVDVNDEYV